MLPEEAYFSVQETLTNPTNRTDSVQQFVRTPLPQNRLLDNRAVFFRFQTIQYD